MQTYRLKDGFTHHHFTGNEHVRLGAGDTVELTDAQARAFADRFEPASGVKSSVSSEPPAEAGEEPVDITSLTVPNARTVISEADAAELDVFDAAESASEKPRQGVLEAIEARREQLEATG